LRGNPLHETESTVHYQEGTSMKLSLGILALTVLSALIAVPAHADKCGYHSGYHYDTPRHAVAGYTYDMRDDYMGHGYTRSMAEVDAPRLAEYRSIFGGSGYAVAGYSSTRSPWMSGGTWVTVNGVRTWASPSDFVWKNDRWVWADDNVATVYFEDPRFNSTSRTWATAWSPWYEGGTWVNVNGQRVWASEDDFVWMNNRWVWAEDNNAVLRFDDDRFNVDAQDWGVNDLTVDSDRFDMDVDRDRFDLDVDADRLNIDEDRLKIETDID
jgi:hypothetical protein